MAGVADIANSSGAQGSVEASIWTDHEESNKRRREVEAKGERSESRTPEESETRQLVRDNLKESEMPGKGI